MINQHFFYNSYRKIFFCCIATKQQNLFGTCHNETNNLYFQYWMFLFRSQTEWITHWMGDSLSQCLRRFLLSPLFAFLDYFILFLFLNIFCVFGSKIGVERKSWQKYFSSGGKKNIDYNLIVITGLRKYTNNTTPLRCYKESHIQREKLRRLLLITTRFFSVAFSQTAFFSLAIHTKCTKWNCFKRFLCCVRTILLFVNEKFTLKIIYLEFLW